MPLRDDANRLRDMLDAAREAVGFAKGTTRSDLDRNRQLVLSLVKCLEIIGEAANNVSAECQDENRHIPWQDMIGMRNRLIHGYFDVNLTIVSKTVSEELPSLITQLEELLD